MRNWPPMNLRLMLAFFLALEAVVLGARGLEPASVAEMPWRTPLEQAVARHLTGCFEVGDPPMSEQIASLQIAYGASEEDMRMALWNLMERALPLADQDVTMKQIAAGAFGCMDRYGTRSDLKRLWPILEANRRMIRTVGIRVYLRLSDYALDDLPEKVLIQREVFDDLDRFQTYQLLAEVFDEKNSLEKLGERRAITAFFRRAALVETDSGCANQIDEFLRANDPAYMESPERRELVRRFGHMQGWRGGTDTGEAERE